MTTVDELIAGQMDVADSIKRILINYRKDSDARKNEEYVKQRLLNLDNLWADFRQRHNQIQVDDSHQYKKSRIYDQVEERYNTTKMLLVEKSEAILKEATLQRQLRKLSALKDTAPTTVPSTSNLRVPSPISIAPVGTSVSTGLTPQSNDYVPTEVLVDQADLPTKLLRLQLSKMNGLRELIQQITDHEDQSFYIQFSQFIKENWIAINNNHDRLVMEATGKILEEPYFSDNQFPALYAEYCKTLIYLQSKINIQQSSTNLNDTDNGLRLPHIKIPTFEGDYKSWTSFHDLFLQTIHKNARLGNAQKLHYLKSVIAGEAAALIKHLSISDDNYTAAWDILVNRYDNKRMLVNNHLATFLSQQSLQVESAAGLKKLHDTTLECINAISNLKINIETWDPILIYIVSQKLDRDTIKLYEQSLHTPKEIQSLSDFMSFLENRFQSLETSKTNKKDAIITERPKIFTRNYHAQVTLACSFCKEQHLTFTCRKYNNLTAIQRLDFIKKNKLCWNCLTSHPVGQCRSQSRCKNCNSNHHTSIHFAIGRREPPRNRESNNNIQNSDSVRPQPAVNHCTQDNTITTLLATALVRASSDNGRSIILRALIDQGSQATFITENARQKLGLPKKKVSGMVTGVGSSKSNHIQAVVQLRIEPRKTSRFSITINALVLSKITKVLPGKQFDYDWEHIKSLELADPNFNQPGTIDLLIGAETYQEIILEGLIKGNSGSPIAQNSEFGWILSGQIKKNLRQHQIVSLVSNVEIDQQLRKFWELEEIPRQKYLTKNEQKAEEHYKKTVSRCKNGRYIVHLPFDDDVKEVLGDSRNRAVARLMQLEKTFTKNPQLHLDYSDFISEYIMLKHMEPIDTKQFTTSSEESFYLPHHAVIKNTSTTTKLRVVFDASARSSSGISLNDKMLTGPTIQQDLWTILLRWRKHKFAFTADIEKMYRQIMITPEHQQFQRILWRPDRMRPIQEHVLTTVTYGTNSAPYLAIRTLQQLAQDEQTNYPMASRIAKEDFYVDDLLSGASTIQEAVNIRNELINLLNSGKFKLRKWSCNCEHVLKDMPEDYKEFGSRSISDETIKTLGIWWNPTTDNFEFKLNLLGNTNRLTKRLLLSEGSKLFDPLGWLAPVTIIAKLTFQETWTLGISWDDELPSHISEKWAKFKTQLPNIENIKIKRWTNYMDDTVNTEIHGFCDSSEKAYAAVIYLKVVQPDGTAAITLLTSKTKVAPIKRISLPRLELCGAVLLSKLLHQVVAAMQLTQSKTFLWTDSTITLAWIKGYPHNWKTFIANRVAEIQNVASPSDWYHVKSGENPADCATRGIGPTELAQHDLWWNGPSWLRNDTYTQCLNREKYETVIESRQTFLVTLDSNDSEFDMFDRYSSFTKLIRILAYCTRFIKNSRCTKMNRTYGALTIDELKESTCLVERYLQRQYFQNELDNIRKHGSNNKSKLKSLNPFIDNEGLLRIGGRLDNSSLTYDEKHPIIIPRKSHITTLLIRKAHIESLHGSNKSTLAAIRNRYWVMDGINAVKRYIHHCTICYKSKAKALNQLMGMLPHARVNLKRAFADSGVDYAGPITLRASKLRRCAIIKGYIAIFVCMATKAIHLEAVTDLTAEAFLAALRRFSARRGKIENIYSDNGTNFVKSNKILQKAVVNNELLDKQIKWHFIPPASPHFGGLWEAGVKSVKQHLRKTIGDTKLTYEELATLLCQVESVLNSRPLCQMNMDPNDLDPLTPGHFLIGSKLSLPADEDYSKSSTFGRWKMIQKMYQEVCSKWKNNYLHQLQNRPKWFNKQPNINIGDLVLLKEDSQPHRWPLARVVDVHPGKDDLTRVVTLKTDHNIVKRPIVKICPLPLNNEEDIKALRTPETIRHNNESSTYNKPLRRSRRRKPILAPYNLLFLATFCMFFTSQTAAIDDNPSFTITPFTTHPGIYFEKTSDVKLIKDEWTILAYYDLSTYWSEITVFENSIRELQKVCNHMTCSTTKEIATVSQQVATLKKRNETGCWTQNTCSQMQEQLEHQLDKINQKNEIIFHHNNRQKRSPFDFIGLAANELFGVLDQRAAKKIEEDITKSRANENYILELLKNQTSITESTVNIMKKSEKAIQTQFSNLQSKLWNMKREEDVTMLTLNTLLLMLDYQTIQEALLDVVLDTHHNKVNPAIITPVQLTKQIDLVRGKIPSSLVIPGNTDRDGVLKLYQLLNCHVAVQQRYVIFRIKLPLLESNTYQLLKIIPIPTLHNRKYVVIQPASEYLIVDLKRENFYPINKGELSECTRNDNMFLCLQKEPLYNSKANQSQCELAILTHNEEFPEFCQFIAIPPQRIWIRMHRPNSWIYVLDREYTIDVICDDKIHNERMKHDGIIQLNPGCSIKEPTMTVTATSSLVTNISSSFLPGFNLSTRFDENNSPLFLFNNTDDLENTAENIANLKVSENRKTWNNLDIHDIHHYALTYILLSAVIGFICVWYYNKKRVRRLTTVAVPRLHTTAEDVNDVIII